LKCYSLVKRRHQDPFAFNAHRDMLLLWANVWPDPQHGFTLVRQHSGPEFQIRSMALTFAITGMDHENLLKRLLMHRSLEELVLYQSTYRSNSLERVMPTTFVSEATDLEGWFQYENDANHLRLFIRFLDQNAHRFPKTQAPILKFMRILGEELEKVDGPFSEYCYLTHSVR
jgi:hypothetical protein